MERSKSTAPYALPFPFSGWGVFTARQRILVIIPVILMNPTAPPLRAFFTRLAAPPWHRRITLSALALLALAGLSAVLYLTAVAPWGYSDSAAYLAEARNLAAWRGFVLQEPGGGFSFYTWHPPLYPLFLSLPIALGADALQAARWLNALLFALSIFLAGGATYRFTRSFWLAGSAAGLALASLDPLTAFSGIMSEGMFILWTFLSLFLLALAFQSPQRRPRLLIFSGLAAGLAFLTRYIGISLLAAGCVSVLILTPGKFWPRMRTLLFFLLPAAALALLWVLPVFLATHSLGSRSLADLSAVSSKLQAYFPAFRDVLGSWLPFFYRGNRILPPDFKLTLAAVLLPLLAWLSARAQRRRGQPLNREGLPGWLLVVGIFCLTYAAVHLGTYLLLFAQPDVNGRLLLPLFFGGALLAAGAADWISRLLPKRWPGALLFTALALLTVWYFHTPLKLYQFEMHHYGQGYTSKRWLDNPVFAELSALDPQTPLYSNNPSLVLFYTGRFPHPLQLQSGGTAFNLDLPAGTTLALFTNAGLGGPSPADINALAGAAERYPILFQNNEAGLFRIP